MPFVLLLLLAWISAAIRLVPPASEGLTLHRTVEIVLSHMLVLNAGVGSLLLFIGHLVRADEVARSLGWPTGTGFQKEVAFASLGLGILGVLSIWFRNDFWTATVVAFAVFYLGATWVHFTDPASRDTRSRLSVFLYSNIVTALLFLGLLAIHKLR